MPGPTVSTQSNTALARTAVDALVRKSHLDGARRYAEASVAVNTRRARDSDWKIFTAWCVARDLSPLPAEVGTVAEFLTATLDEEEKALATVVRYKGTISKVHRLKGLPSPCADARVKAVLEGMRRSKTVRSPFAKLPVTLDVVTRVLVAAGEPVGPRALRDRAVLLLGFASAMRREELVALDVSDLTWRDEGAEVTIRKSKTDQWGVGRRVGIPRVEGILCPVQALRAWVGALGGTSGPLFRRIRKGNVVSADRLCPPSVATIVKAFAEKAGLEPADFGGHSMRSGYVTQARRAGLTWTEIMDQTGHRSLNTVRRYAREEGALDPFRNSRVREVLTERNIE